MNGVAYRLWKSADGKFVVYCGTSANGGKGIKKTVEWLVQKKSEGSVTNVRCEPEWETTSTKLERKKRKRELKADKSREKTRLQRESDIFVKLEADGHKVIEKGKVAWIENQPNNRSLQRYFLFSNGLVLIGKNRHLETEEWLDDLKSRNGVFWRY